MPSDNHQFNHDETTPEETAAAQVTAYALGQLPGEERAEIERRLAANGDGALQREIGEMEALAAAVSAARASDALPPATPALRQRLENRLSADAQKVELRKRTPVRALIWLGVGAAACAVLAALALPAVQ